MSDSDFVVHSDSGAVDVRKTIMDAYTYMNSRVSYAEREKFSNKILNWLFKIDNDQNIVSTYDPGACEYIIEETVKKLNKEVQAGNEVPYLYAFLAANTAAENYAGIMRASMDALLNFDARQQVTLLCAKIIDSYEKDSGNIASFISSLDRDHPLRSFFVAAAREENLNENIISAHIYNVASAVIATIHHSTLSEVSFLIRMVASAPVFEGKILKNIDMSFIDMSEEIQSLTSEERSSRIKGLVKAYVVITGVKLRIRYPEQEIARQQLDVMFADILPEYRRTRLMNQFEVISNASKLNYVNLTAKNHGADGYYIMVNITTEVANYLY